MRTLLSLIIVALVGCAGSPTVAHYLLRFDPSASPAAAEASPHVGLGLVDVAPYLAASDGIVVETAPSQVRSANQHVWAEPLSAGLRSYLRAALAAELGYDVSATLPVGRSLDYRVDVYVDRLHGDLSGRAVLDAVYRISARARSEAEIHARFSSSVPQPREGYGGVVEAEAALARELAAAIAGAIRGIEAAPEP